MKIQNRDRLNAKLRALPAAAKAEIRKALETDAQEIVDLAKRFVPVKTGALKNSIGYNFDDASSLPNAATASGLVVTIYAGDDNAWYARLVEFGTKPHVNKGEFKGSQNPGAPAEPFFFPAYRLGKKRAKARLGRAYNTAAKKVASQS